MRFNLKALIERDTPLRRVCSKDGGEYAGPCPFCRRGVDRFHFWEGAGRWACLGPEAGRAGCGVGGDAVDYLRRRDGLSYREACAALGISEGFNAGAPAASSRTRKDADNLFAPLRLCVEKDFPDPTRGRVEPASPPNETWQARGRSVIERCQARLWAAEGRRALDYLHARGLGDEILRAHAAGYLSRDEREPRALWGLPEEAGAARPIWLPRGIVLPWFAGGALWRINIRRPLSPRQARAGEPKYIGPAGFAPGLYNADALSNADALAPGRPALLVEGEIDALTAAQEVGDLVAAVAAGSTSGARRAAWVERLAAAPAVLLAFDCDRRGPGGSPGAGEQAAAWWLQVLPNAVRWRPLLHDVNAMHTHAVPVRSWAAAGVEYAMTRLSGRKGKRS